MSEAQKYELMMAVPDAEFVMIAKRLIELKHSDHITLVSSNKEHIRFIKRGDKIKAIRQIDGKPTLFHVEPMSKMMPNEREMMKKHFHDKNPSWNNARLEAECDIVYEMRESVKKIVEETGLTHEQAFKLLERGLVEKELEQRHLTAFPEGSIDASGASLQ